MTCEHWWRRQLRRHQGRTVEAAAIRIGRVCRHRELYISEERLQARTQQLTRNAATLETTLARNELGQEFTLAELAEKSTANKRVRRCELMTRIVGFERIAQDMSHAGLFVTLTCPSRFHRFHTVNQGQTIKQNPKYDSRETPLQGQRYLAQVWARIRTYLARNNIHLYGFRIAEPQHDGTPHWHMLLFCPSDAKQTVGEAMTRYALQDTPDEPGAKAHRCDIKNIDPTKGSATGYVAKYVAKNIDGHGVGEDFNGKPSTETARRVEAWAATWGIRQFQQIGGPPVGVWRELRRVNDLPANAPAHLRQAHAAANRTAASDEQEGTRAAWDQYCLAQGGVFCGRKYRIQLTVEERDGLGLYGEERTPMPVGVETSGIEYWTPAHMAHLPGHPIYKHAERVVNWFVRSERRIWEIVRAVEITEPHALAGIDLGELAPDLPGPQAPWTCVNNCTVGIHEEASDHANPALSSVDNAPRYRNLSGSPPRNALRRREGLTNLD